MERCPVELLAKICRNACTDGGRTGCSLSLVSHYVHNVVQPFRYHSIFLTSSTSALTFARHLQGLHNAPAIRYLFISVFMNSKQWGDDWASEDELSALDTAVATVIRITAPQLRVLILHQTRRIFYIDPCPQLEYLSVPYLPASRPDHKSESPRWNSSIPTIAPVKRSSEPTLPPPFPSLRYLHLSECSRIQDTVWDDLSSFSPAVTHLRLTDIEAASLSSRFLRMLLKRPSGLIPKDASGIVSHVFPNAYTPGSKEEIQAITRAARLPNLRNVFVQPAVPLNDDGWCGTTGFREEQRRMDLRLLAMSCAATPDASGKLYLLPETEGYDFEQAHAQWLDLIEGGKGPWCTGLCQDFGLGDDSGGDSEMTL